MCYPNPAVLDTISALYHDYIQYCSYLARYRDNSSSRFLATRLRTRNPPSVCTSVDPLLFHIIRNAYNITVVVINTRCLNRFVWLLVHLQCRPVNKTPFFRLGLATLFRVVKNWPQFLYRVCQNAEWCQNCGHVLWQTGWKTRMDSVGHKNRGKKHGPK